MQAGVLRFFQVDSTGYDSGRTIAMPPKLDYSSLSGDQLLSVVPDMLEYLQQKGFCSALVTSLQFLRVDAYELHPADVVLQFLRQPPAVLKESGMVWFGRPHAPIHTFSEIADALYNAEYHEITMEFRRRSLYCDRGPEKIVLLPLPDGTFRCHPFLPRDAIYAHDVSTSHTAFPSEGVYCKVHAFDDLPQYAAGETLHIPMVDSPENWSKEIVEQFVKVFLQQWERPKESLVSARFLTACTRRLTLLGMTLRSAKLHNTSPLVWFRTQQSKIVSFAEFCESVNRQLFVVSSVLHDALLRGKLARPPRVIVFKLPDQKYSVSYPLYGEDVIVDLTS